MIFALTETVPPLLLLNVFLRNPQAGRRPAESSVRTPKQLSSSRRRLATSTCSERSHSPREAPVERRLRLVVSLDVHEVFSWTTADIRCAGGEAA